MFQSTVNINQSIGEPGDIYSNQPYRVTTANLASVDPTLNIFGRAFTVSDNLNQPTSAQAGRLAATDAYAGILVNPKDYASFGSSGNPLAPSLVLPNGAIGQFMSMGQVIVRFEISPLAGIAHIGDLVAFEDATGKLTCIPPGAGLPGGFSYAFGNVFLPISPSQTYPQLCVITLTPPSVAEQNVFGVLT